MDSQYNKKFRLALSVFDFITLNLIYFILILLIRRIESDTRYITLILISNVAWAACSFLWALYIDKHTSKERFFRRSIQTYLSYVTMVLIFLFLYQYNFSRLFILLSLSTYFFWLCGSRVAYLLRYSYIKKQKKNHRKVVLLGCNDLAMRLVEYFDKYSNGIIVAGYFDDKQDTSFKCRLPYLGRITESLPFAITNNVAEIYSTILPEKDPLMYDLAREAEKNFIRFKLVPDFRLFIKGRVHLDFLSDIPVFSLRPEPLEQITGKRMKRIFDIVFSLFIILFLLSWLLPIIALIIKLDSRGPVFFTQMRSGKNNEPFLCFKFRSLHHKIKEDADQVTRNDHRHTRVGKYLRKFNVDELPQFFNVILGDMSIVGPRPHMIVHTKKFAGILDEYMLRHFVKPGITGWAQINGYRGEVPNEAILRKRIEHDIHYMENWSLWFDFRIVLLTVASTIKGDGTAY